MKKVHDNVRKRYSDKTMLIIKTNYCKSNKHQLTKERLYVLEVHWGKTGFIISKVVVQFCVGRE